MIGGRQSVDQESFMVYVQDDGKNFIFTLLELRQTWDTPKRDENGSNEA